jgi:hypothetical protein
VHQARADRADTEHELVLRGLWPATEYRCTIDLGTAGRTSVVMRTAHATVIGHALARDGDDLVLCIETNGPINVEAAVGGRVRAGAEGAGAPSGSARPRSLHRLPDPVDAAFHRFRIPADDLGGDRPGDLEVRLTYRTPVGPAPLGTVSVPSLAARVRALARQLATPDPAALARSLRRAQVSDPLPDAASWLLQRETVPQREALPELRWLVPLVLEERRVSLSVVSRTYELVNRLSTVQAIAVALGLAAALDPAPVQTGSFRLATAPPFLPDAKLVARLPRPAVPFVPFGSPNFLDYKTLGVVKTSEEVVLDVPPPPGAPGPASWEVAAILLPIEQADPKSHRDNSFHVTVNDSPPLMLRYGQEHTARGGSGLPGLYHTFDPRFLTASTRIRVTMPPLPGLEGAIGQVTFDRVELWLARRGPRSQRSQ